MTRTKLRSRRGTGFVLAGALVAGGLVLAVAASADTPPWQHASNKYNDPNSVGTLAFYNAAGKQIFSGSVDAQPFAAYVEGSKALSKTDTAASLYAYLPVKGSNEGAWTGELLTAASTYPNSAAPGALATAAPLETGTSGDTSLAEFIAGHPNKSKNASFQGIYELRLRTSGAGTVASTSYDSADVEVTGTKWRVVYPGHFKDSTTSVKLSKSSGLKVGGKVTLKATVGPAGATGKVAFSEGGTSLGSASVSSGTASKKVTIPHGGKQSFKATYVPDSASAYAGSTGSVSAKVAKASTKTAATWPKSAVHSGKSFTVKVRVKGAGPTPVGKVSVESGSKTIASAKLKHGKATITVKGSALKPGKHRLTVAYSGSSDDAASTSAAKTIKIVKGGSAALTGERVS